MPGTAHIIMAAMHFQFLAGDCNRMRKSSAEHFVSVDEMQKVTSIARYMAKPLNSVSRGTSQM